MDWIDDIFVPFWKKRGSIMRNTRIAKKISRRSFLQASGLLAAAALGSGLTGCGNTSSGAASPSASSTSEAASAVSTGEHEPITIMDAQRDYTAVIALAKEKYPELNIQIMAYKGQNTTAYMHKQLETGIMPDIYCSTQIWPAEEQKAHLIDLSRYSITDLYNEVRMNDTDVDGATYLLPYDYNIVAIGYNASLFERQGWTVPTNMQGLRDLLPQIRAAGVNPCVCMMNLPGYGFQYFCNIADTVFLTTTEGKQWKEDFLAGKANASDHLQPCIDAFQEWMDLGMVNTDVSGMLKTEVTSLYREGNTAFYIGGLGLFSQYDDGTGDQYKFMPYLAEDSSDNMYIIQMSRFYGLNNQLEEPGNEQKLEDALHFLEVMSTMEGYERISGGTPSMLCSLRDFSLQTDSPYYDVLAEINNGHSTPLLYGGWEDYIVPFGNKVLDWAAGKGTGAEALATLDEMQKTVMESGTIYYAEAPEELTEEQTAEVIAQAYIDATGVDGVLYSLNVWKEGVSAAEENMWGANGRILPGGITEEDIVAYLPTGWYGTIHTLTLPGQRIKELVDIGYDLHDDGNTYPYRYFTMDGTDASQLDDAAEYTIAYCGATDAVLEEGGDEDTGVVGLDAVKAYFHKVGTVSTDLLAH